MKRLMRNRIALSVGIGIVLGSSLTLCPTLSASESPRAWVFEDRANFAEVRLRRPDAKLQIHLVSQSSLGLPDHIEVSLTGRDGKKVNLELNAISPDSLSPEAKRQRDYLGSSPASLDSFVGIAVRLPLGWTRPQPLFDGEK